MLQFRDARGPLLAQAGWASEAGRMAEPRATGGNAVDGQAEAAQAGRR